MSETVSSNVWTNFLEGVPNPHTQEGYVNNVKFFMREMGISTPDELLQGTGEFLEDRIRGFIAKRKPHSSGVTIYRTICALKLFYDMNRKTLNWKYVRKAIGKSKKRTDKAYTHEQIRAGLAVANNLRVKYETLLLCSSGVREGALPTLNVGNRTKLESGVGRYVIYEGYDEEYVTFSTPECEAAADAYLAYRERCGEKIEAETPLLRQEFDPDIMQIVKRPERITEKSLFDDMVLMMERAGVRKRIRLVEGQQAGAIRHPVKAVHGLRKFYDTQTTLAGISPLWVEMLEGHDIKLKESYFRPSETDLLEGNDRMHGYLDAIDYLTINEENKLKRKVSVLERKNEELSKQKETINNLNETVSWLVEAEKERRKLDGYEKELEKKEKSSNSV
jgi:hypothetical protein